MVKRRIKERCERERRGIRDYQRSGGRGDKVEEIKKGNTRIRKI